MNLIHKAFIYFVVALAIIFGFLTPFDFNNVLGEKSRIIFFHVPVAWISVLAFFISMIYSVKFIKTRNLYNEIVAFSAAEIGFVFSILATITGSIFAKFTWGSFWNWDPRETSIFILFLIYGAYFSLRISIDSTEKKAMLSSVYLIIAFITVPFFIFIMPRIVSSLHPSDTFFSKGTINMSMGMMSVFFLCLFAFTILFFWILNLKIRIEKLKSIKNLK